MISLNIFRNRFIWTQEKLNEEIAIIEEPKEEIEEQPQLSKPKRKYNNTNRTRNALDENSFQLNSNQDRIKHFKTLINNKLQLK